MLPLPTLSRLVFLEWLVSQKGQRFDKSIMTGNQRGHGELGVVPELDEQLKHT